MATLPGSTLDIFPINLGGNPFGWTTDQAQSFAVLDAFCEAGGNFIDSADAYSMWVDGNSGGESETIIGQWMAARGNRDDVLVATKVGMLESRKGLAHFSVVAALDDSLKRLGTDHVDLYYAHYDDEDVAIADQVETFHSLVTAGKARAIGLSNFSPARMREWFQTAQHEGMTMPSAIQPRYSLVSRADYERDYAPIVEEFGVAVFTYPALASGFLSGKYRTDADFDGKPRGNAARRYYEAGGLKVVDALVEIAEARGTEPTTVALAWLLAKDITAPIASASRPEQLDATMAAPSLRLTEDDVTALDAASASF
ncbi:MAG: aldo/keto reductase [Ornithinimicrobium sp.]